MTHGQLALVLIGVTLAIAALVVLVRARAIVRPRPRGRGELLGSAVQPALVSGQAESAPDGHAVPALGEPAAQRSARLDALHKLQVIAFGTAIAPAPAASSLPDEHAIAIRLTLAGIADKPNYAPRRPLLLPKLMQAMNDDEVSRRELSRIIATDPALAGSLLRLANSPFYRISSEPVESLDRAIALLGLEGMRSLIAAALLQPVFRINGGMFMQFGEVTWEHTLYSASAAEAHAAVVENSDPFAAQLLSLLMGLATIVVFRVATDEFLSHRLPPSPGVLAGLIDSETALVARHIAASWELSERIDTALADQTALSGAHSSSLGRSLQIGRFLGALALLHARHVMNEDEVQGALQSGGALAGAYERIWARLRAAT